MSYILDVCLFTLGCLLDLIIIIPCLIYLLLLQIICFALTLWAGDDGRHFYSQRIGHQEQSVKTLLTELGRNEVNQFNSVFMSQERRVKVITTHRLIKQDEVDSVPQKDGYLLNIFKTFIPVHIVNSVSAVWSKSTRFHVTVTGNVRNSDKDILERLGISPRDKVPSMDECDVILAFIPIVSRAGTDIEAALMKIPEIHPAVIVVLHHTFDPDYVAPDSRRKINRSNVLVVDCLFHEDVGLLKCARNSKALKETEKYLQDFKADVGQSLLSGIVQWLRR
ncbi:uncharacterized protein Hap1MRO34_004397 isoform 2-T2 [Clarias gariepinus]